MSSVGITAMLCVCVCALWLLAADSNSQTHLFLFFFFFLLNPSGKSQPVCAENRFKKKKTRGSDAQQKPAGRKHRRRVGASVVLEAKFDFLLLIPVLVLVLR